ncbi:glycoside hydrolase family 99-like domain-containing protein [Bacteroidota bacterium]
MKNIKYIFIVLMGLLAFACEEDRPSAEDHFLNYTIEDVPPTHDYIVGAHYKSFTWDEDIMEIPTAGKYEAERGDPMAYQKHVDWAGTAGIDYFLFRFRSSNDSAQHVTDIAFIDTLQLASNAGSVNFALNYDFGSMGLQDNKRIEAAGMVPAFLADFNRMIPYFQMSNYMKIDNKVVVMINNAYELHSDDNVSLYQQLRSQMSAAGIELFIIGTQQSWSPPVRYDFRFVGCVDAVTHDTYIEISNSWYDRYILFHNIVDQALTYSAEKFTEYGLEYGATISPSFNPTITVPSATDFIIKKDMAWFTTYCNVAKRSSTGASLVFIDSFNDWSYDTQLEPAQSYGQDYLTLIRQQFKVN